LPVELLETDIRFAGQPVILGHEADLDRVRFHIDLRPVGLVILNGYLASTLRRQRHRQ
jgi:hypothetical protein